MAIPPTKEQKDIIVAAISELKAIDTIELHVAPLTSVTDYFIICTGSSNRHVKSIADNLIKQAKEHKLQIIGTEGMESGDWVLVDLGDIVAHIMLPETRERYQLEKLWSQIPSPHITGTDAN